MAGAVEWRVRYDGGSHHGICDIAEQNYWDDVCQNPDWAPHCFHHSFIQAVLCSIFIIPAFPILISFSCVLVFPLSKNSIYSCVLSVFVQASTLHRRAHRQRRRVQNKQNYLSPSASWVRSPPELCLWCRAVVWESVRASGSSTCDLPPAAGWAAGLQADQLLASWGERVPFWSCAQRSNEVMLNVESSVCLSHSRCSFGSLPKRWQTK